MARSSRIAAGDRRSTPTVRLWLRVSPGTRSRDGPASMIVSGGCSSLQSLPPGAVGSVRVPRSRRLLQRQGHARRTEGRPDANRNRRWRACCHYWLARSGADRRRTLRRCRMMTADAVPCDALRMSVGRLTGRSRWGSPRSLHVDRGAVYDCILACLHQAGEGHGNVARMARLLAGLSVDAPGGDGQPAVPIGV